MDIPLLSKEEIEKEDIGDEDEDIRCQIIKFLKSKGYRYLPGSQVFGDETSDFFTKDDQLIEVIISDEIPEEILEQMAEIDAET